MRLAAATSRQLLAALLAACATAPATAADYSFDPTHTTVHIEFDAPGGLSTQRARFNKSEGRLAFDRAARNGQVEVTVQAASLTSGAPTLDAVLRGPAVLDAEAHPTVQFSSSAFRFDGDRLIAVDGTLTLKGQASPLTLRATRFDCYTNPLFRREVCGGDFEARIDRAALGIGEGSVRLIVQIEALRQ